MDKAKAAAIAASAWNSFEASHGRTVAITPADVIDELEGGDLAEVIDRLQWYAAQGGGLYSPVQVQDVIDEYDSASGCAECERSFGPHYRGHCEH